MATKKSPCSYSTLRRRIREQTERDLQEIANQTNLQNPGTLIEHNNIQEFSKVSTCEFTDENIASTEQMSLSEIPLLHAKESQPFLEEISADLSGNFFAYTGCNQPLSDGVISLNQDGNTCSLGVENTDVVYNLFSPDCNDSETSEENSDDNLWEELRSWAVQFNVTHSAIAVLLKILQPHHKYLPSDPRTLLKTPRYCPVSKLKSGGEYCHIGLRSGLLNFLQRTTLECECVELQFNIDGLPIYKSSSLSVWPIQCLVVNTAFKSPFFVGIYSGCEKPGDANEFLKDFLTELRELVRTGLSISEKHYTVVIHSFICDAPARSFLKNIKSHSGYSACEKCMQHGEYIGKVIFPLVDAPLRTDEQFNAMLDEGHHIGLSPLASLGIGMVTSFGLDYMHLVCLGVVKRMLLYWKGPIGPKQVRLGSQLVSQISIRQISLRNHIPCEFARKPRSLQELPRWKATEFRELLLYTGFAVLDGNLKNEALFKHFLVLACAIRILASPQVSNLECDYANDLLRLFVMDAKLLYGTEMLVYNVHCLVHLAADVSNLGPLDNFSCFIYENKLGELKRMIRKPNLPLQQLVNRLSEKENVEMKVHDEFKASGYLLKSEHCNGPIPDNVVPGRQYKKVHTPKFMFSSLNGNNCILTNIGIPALIRNIIEVDGSVRFICSEFTKVGNAFEYPLPSSKLNIFRASNVSKNLVVLELMSDVRHKCMCLPVGNDGNGDFIIVPILHH